MSTSIFEAYKSCLEFMRLILLHLLIQFVFYYRNALIPE
jgi:hypothetical protein